MKRTKITFGIGFLVMGLTALFLQFDTKEEILVNQAQEATEGILGNSLRLT